MTLTIHDAHNTERMILVGCDDAYHAPHTQVLRLSAFEPEHWFDITKQWLADHVLFDTVSMSVFVEPRFKPMFEQSGLRELIEAHYQQARINTNTVAARGEQQGINVVKNLKRIAEGSGQDALKALSRMDGQTAIVCGAGPSLDDCYEWLVQHEGPVVAVNTSAAAVLKEHVIVDLIVCSESKELSEWKHALDAAVGGRETSIPVAIDLMSHPTHPDGIGPALYFASADPSLAPTARALGMQPIGYGPSCTTAAVALCLALGAEKVLLVGQDCAFRELRHQDSGLGIIDCTMYARGAPYEATSVSIDVTTNRAVIDKPTKGRSEADAVQVEGVDGQIVWTMPSILSFMHWFRDQPDNVRARVINCSSHGVKLEGIEHRPLSECVQTGNAYDGTLVPDESGDPFADKAEYALYRMRKELGWMNGTSDAALMESALQFPLLNFWTNPAKLRVKLEHGNVTPFVYGKAIADAVWKAWRDIRSELG